MRVLSGLSVVVRVFAPDIRHMTRHPVGSTNTSSQGRRSHRLSRMGLLRARVPIPIPIGINSSLLRHAPSDLAYRPLSPMHLPSLYELYGSRAGAVCGHESGRTSHWLQAVEMRWRGCGTQPPVVTSERR
jgi:hypothetical protein